MDDERRKQIQETVEHFRGEGKLVTNDLLDEYTRRRGFTPIVLTDFEDFLFQIEHDERFAKHLPLILAEIQKVAIVPEFGTHEERKKAEENNKMVELSIAKIIEDNDILYKEAEILVKNLGDMLQGICIRTSNRINNMGAAAMLDLSEQTLGAPLTVKALSTYFNKRAEEIGKE